MSSSSPSLPRPWSMPTTPPATLAPFVWTSEGQRPRTDQEGQRTDKGAKFHTSVAQRKGNLRGGEGRRPASGLDDEGREETCERMETSGKRKLPNPKNRPTGLNTELATLILRQMIAPRTAAFKNSVILFDEKCGAKEQINRPDASQISA